MARVTQQEEVKEVDVKARMYIQKKVALALYIKCLRNALNSLLTLPERVDYCAICSNEVEPQGSTPTGPQE